MGAALVHTVEVTEVHSILVKNVKGKYLLNDTGMDGHVIFKIYHKQMEREAVE
jgi:hypothetical protein